MKIEHHSLKVLSSLLLLLLMACGSSGGLGTPEVSSASDPQPNSVAAQNSDAAPLMRSAPNLAQFRKVNDWNSGFTGEIIITNTTGRTHQRGGIAILGGDRIGLRV